MINHLALPFLPTLAGASIPDQALALYDDFSQEWMSYGDLRNAIHRTQQAYNKGSRAFVFCCTTRCSESVIAYLSAASSGHAVALVDPAMPHLDEIVHAYKPDWIVAPKSMTFAHYDCVEWEMSRLSLHCRKDDSVVILHPDFFLLLLTSGSTGSSKGVRLSYKALTSNTAAIIESLSQTPHWCAICHLPLSYSFGLSVLHTQLAVGGRCIMTDASLLGRDFWEIVRAHNVTLFPGVPYHYQMLARLGLDKLNVPTLRTFLQAGGKMSPQLTSHILQEVLERAGELFIMYGQTEAAPRISSMPLHVYSEKVGASGTVLKNGKLSIRDGEIIYNGPNVMMGYAQSADDLSKGDTCHGSLVTGDLGSLDSEGFLTITGRKQRFAKLFGQRISLDDLERIANQWLVCVAIEKTDKIMLATTEVSASTLAQVKETLATQTKIPPSWVDFVTIGTIPYKSNGKIDHEKLRGLL